MNKDLSQDFRVLAEHLSPLDFRALSSGIGLGTKKVEDAKRFHAAPAKKAATPVSTPKIAALPPSPKITEKPSMHVQTKRSWLRRCLAYTLDLLIVGVSLIFTSFAFFYAVDGASFQKSKWLAWFLGRWFKLIGPSEAVLAVLLGLCAYTLLFRLLAGATIGEIAVVRRKERARVKERRSLQGSKVP